jgi:DnaJ-class molecular chaperone
MPEREWISTGIKDCAHCNGTGKVKKRKFWSGEEYFLKCKVCKGEGRFEHGYYPPVDYFRGN